jgi:hypothetical protein
MLFGKKGKNDASDIDDAPILMTAHGFTDGGDNKQLDLTDTNIIITTYKKVFKTNWSIKPKWPEVDHIKIDKIKKIPRTEINHIAMNMEESNFTIYLGKSSEKAIWNPDQLIEFEKLFAALDMKRKAEEDAIMSRPWYWDDTKLSHIVTYRNAEKATREAEAASSYGWMPQSTSRPMVIST